MRTLPDCQDGQSRCTSRPHAGLPVVESELRRVGGGLIGRIKRHDRTCGPAGRVRRLHLEGPFQALGYSSRTKYGAGAGPSFAHCLRLVHDVSGTPRGDLEELLRWQIFHVLTGSH